jgi:hypothetical protein
LQHVQACPADLGQAPPPGERGTELRILHLEGEAPQRLGIAQPGAEQATADLGRLIQHRPGDLLRLAGRLPRRLGHGPHRLVDGGLRRLTGFGLLGWH